MTLKEIKEVYLNPKTVEARFAVNIPSYEMSVETELYRYEGIYNGLVTDEGRLRDYAVIALDGEELANFKFAIDDVYGTLEGKVLAKFHQRVFSKMFHAKIWRGTDDAHREAIYQALFHRLFMSNKPWTFSENSILSAYQTLTELKEQGLI